MVLQVLGKLHRIQAVALEAERQRLEPQQQAPRAEWVLAAAEVAQALETMHD